jgi:hypothetical protein
MGPDSVRHRLLDEEGDRRCLLDTIAESGLELNPGQDETGK